MANDDLIRRGDALSAIGRLSADDFDIHELRLAIAALPAVTQPAPDAAAIREAADLVDAKLARMGFPATGGGSREEMRHAILALITEKPHDRA